MNDFAKEMTFSSIYSVIKFFYIELDERAVFFIFNVMEPVYHVLVFFQ